MQQAQMETQQKMLRTKWKLKNLGLYPPEGLVTQAMLILHQPKAHINQQR